MRRPYTQATASPMQLIAHRGCSAHEIENTLPAFRAALICGADGIETDLRQSIDGTVWLFHDDKLMRLTGWVGGIENGQAKSLRGLRMESGARLASLNDLLELLRKFPRPDFLLNLELKGSKINQFRLAIKIAAMEQAGEFREMRVTVSSFDHAALRELRKRSPNISLAPLWSGSGLFATVLHTASALKAEALHLAVRAITVRRVEAIHKAGFLVRVYTVNDPKLAKKLAELGVDGIFTDDPGAMR